MIIIKSNNPSWSSVRCFGGQFLVNSMFDVLIIVSVIHQATTLNN